MRSLMRLSVPFISAFILAIAFMPVSGPAAVEYPTHPVHVSTCNPSRNTTVSGGYAPAYYPGGPWYWNDVYGYRYYQAPYVSSNPTLSISYTNVTNQTMKQIEFGLVARGALIAEVRDVGTFSPNAEIKHEFGISPNVFPIGTGLPQCVPLRITFADGTKWKNPHYQELKRSINEPPR